LNEEESLRICILIDGFYPYLGGSEIVALDFARGFIRLGAQVMVVTRRIDPKLPAEELFEGIKIYRLPPTGHASHFHSILTVFTVAYFLIRHRRKYDFLHVHGARSFFIAAILAHWLTGAKFSLRPQTTGEINRQEPSDRQHSMFSKILRRYLLPKAVWLFLLRQTTCFIATTRLVIEELSEAGVANKTFHIPHSIDVERFTPASTDERSHLRKMFGIPDDSTVIISHGRIAQVKRLDLIIRAVAELKTEYPNFYLILPGSPYPPTTGPNIDLSALATSLGIEDIVHFPGSTNEPEKYLKAADLFVLASERESGPLSVMEAMAAGLPIISTTVGSVPEFLDDDSAYLFPPFDQQALTLALKQALDNLEEAQHRGKKARQIAQQRFSLESQAKQHIELYERLLKA
jgi:glycosyltransferase involved in cell wall biosynthesis